jgi:hypothetical protein
MSVLNTSVHWSAQNIVLYGRSKMEMVRKSFIRAYNCYVITFAMLLSRCLNI